MDGWMDKLKDGEMEGWTDWKSDWKWL